MRKTARFELAGKINLKETCYLTTKSRVYTKNHRIFHRNDWHSIIEIPMDVFKKYFEYDRFSGIYQTVLTYELLIEVGGILCSQNIEWYYSYAGNIIDYNDEYYAKILQECL